MAVAEGQKTLILPLVGMANVPQYAAQLGIDAHRNELTKDCIHTKYLYPFLGGEVTVKDMMDGTSREGKMGDESSSAFAYPWEIYVHAEGGEVPDIMQLRSPIIPGCESLFVKQVANEIRKGGYGKVIVLDSKDRGLWHGDSDALNVDVMQWRSVTMSELSVSDAADERIHVLESVEETSPVLRLLVEELQEGKDGLCADVGVQYYCVAVYEGWNWPAVAALQRHMGIGADSLPLGVGRREQQWTEDVYV